AAAITTSGQSGLPPMVGKRGPSLYGGQSSRELQPGTNGRASVGKQPAVLNEDDKSSAQGTKCAYFKPRVAEKNDNAQARACLARFVGFVLRSAGAELPSE